MYNTCMDNVYKQDTCVHKALVQGTFMHKFYWKCEHKSVKKNMYSVYILRDYMYDKTIH